MSRCHTAELFEERLHNGEQLAIRPFPLPGGGRMITLPRQDLHAPLIASAQAAGVEIEVDSHSTWADPEGVLVSEDGRVWPADLVVGAVGIRSRVPTRSACSRSTKRSVGASTACWCRSVGRPARRVSGGICQLLDLEQRRRVLYVPCNDEDLYLFLGARQGDEQALRTPLSTEVWSASFPVLAPVLCELPASPRFDDYEVLRTHSWHRARAAIVGDAAHAMPPTIDQGGGTAMMNALALAPTSPSPTTSRQR